MFTTLPVTCVLPSFLCPSPQPDQRQQLFVQVTNTQCVCVTSTNICLKHTVSVRGQWLVTEEKTDIYIKSTAGVLLFILVILKICCWPEDGFCCCWNDFFFSLSFSKSQVVSCSEWFCESQLDHLQLWLTETTRCWAVIAEWSVWMKFGKYVNFNIGWSRDVMTLPICFDYISDW